MSFAIQARVTGLEDLFKRMEGLKAAVQKKILRKALGEASKVVLKAAKASLDGMTSGDATGQTRRSLGRRTKTFRNTGVVVVIIGPRTGFKVALPGGQWHNPTNIAHLIERGRQAVAARNQRVLSNRVKVFGKVVAAVPARPFMQTAWNSQLANVERIVREKILEGIEEAAKS